MNLKHLFVLFLIVFIPNIICSENSNLNGIKSSENKNQSTEYEIVSETTTTTTTTETPLPIAPKLSGKQKLRKKLLKDYDKMVHPVINHTDAVNVNIGMALIHMNIDEMKGIFSVEAWMRLNWTDEHLRWDPEEYGGVKSLHFAFNEIWKPDILLYNSVEEANFDPYGKTHYLVSSTGEVLWVPPAQLKGLCKLNLRMWPFDKQTCHLKFGSWTSHGDEINLGLFKNMKKVEILNFYSNNQEWQIEDTEVTSRRIKYACCEEHYPDVNFRFDLARISPAYRSTIILPCIVVMFMTVCGFILPPNSGEKILLNGFALVISVMYLIYFTASIPFHEKETPLLVTFYSNTTGLISIALFLNVLCLSMVRERKYLAPPKMMKKLFTGHLGKILCLGNYYHQISSTHQRLNLELSDMTESEQQTEEDNTEVSERQIFNNNDRSAIMRDWILVAAGMERIFLIFYTLSFAVVVSVYV